MACLNCYRSREEGDTYCRSCGENLVTGEDQKHTINILMALLGAELLVSIVWLAFQKIIAPLLFKNPFGDTDWQRLAPVYKIFGWFTDGALIIVTLICMLLIKNKNARTLLIVYLVFRVILMVAYRVFDQV